jgi:hypothetical protein
MTTIRLVMTANRPIKGPRGSGVVESYQPFNAPLNWLQSGAQNSLWRQGRLLSVDDYIGRLAELSGRDLEVEGGRAGVDITGDIKALIIDKMLDVISEDIPTGAGEDEPSFGFDDLTFRDLQARAKDLGINARQTRDALVIAILEAEALNGGEVGE